MKVISIDPGYERCGIAVLEKQKGNEVLLHSECVRTDKNLPFSERLLIIGKSVEKVIKEYKPESLALETLYFSKNTKTAISVAEARGVITYAAACSDIPLFEYSPAAIKIAVTGMGNADKRQVMDMVPKLISLPEREMLDDEVDAIALGITHLASVR